MNRCPEHPDKDTMVPCLECGRYFCRICKPPRGAGQLCPVCYEKSISRLVDKAKTEPEERKRLTLKFRKKEKGERRWNRQDILKRLGDVGRKILYFPGAAVEYLVVHFPLGLVDKEETGGSMPPLLKSWYKLLIIIVGSILIWVLATGIIQRRTGLISVITALIVAIGVIFALDRRMDLEVAIVAASITLFVLGIGEIIVYVLYRSDMIQSLNIVWATLADIDDPVRYFFAYCYDMVVMRLLPGCIVAFTVALWPFSRQFTWVGFKYHKKAQSSSNSRAEAPARDQRVFR